MGSMRGSWKAPGVPQTNEGTYAGMISVAYRLLPIPTDAPVVKDVLIPVFVKSPIWSHSMSCPESSPFFSRKSRADRKVRTLVYVFLRSLLFVLAPRFTHSPTKECPRKPSCCLFA